MTCDQARELLADLPARILSGAETAAVRGHLDVCPNCRLDWDALASLRPPLETIRREIAPPRDLWEGIAPRLRRQDRLAVPVWLAVAAALTLVAASSATTWWLARPTHPVTTIAAEGVAGYDRAAAELAQAYLSSRSKMAPETRLVVERSLAVIERALGEAREALRQDPANGALEAVVIAVYRRKIDFLEHATSLDRES